MCLSVGLCVYAVCVVCVGVCLWMCLFVRVLCGCVCFGVWVFVCNMCVCVSVFVCVDMYICVVCVFGKHFVNQIM